MTRVSERMREGVISPVPGTELCTITPDETLDHAARKMFRNKVGRLVVVHPETEEPVGTISHLDLARVRRTSPRSPSSNCCTSVRSRPYT